MHAYYTSRQTKQCEAQNVVMPPSIGKSNIICGGGSTCDAGHLGGLGGADALKGDAGALGNEWDEALLLAVHQCH